MYVCSAIESVLMQILNAGFVVETLLNLTKNFGALCTHASRFAFHLMTIMKVIFHATGTILITTISKSRDSSPDICRDLASIWDLSIHNTYTYDEKAFWNALVSPSPLLIYLSGRPNITFLHLSLPPIPHCWKLAVRLDFRSKLVKIR